MAMFHGDTAPFRMEKVASCRPIFRILYSIHLNSLSVQTMLCPFRRLEHYWTLRALGLLLPLEWALMLVFLIVAAAAGGWTLDVCMTCPANTVLADFQGIRQ